jgi:DNA polymerase III subunit gamma/tau
LPPILKQTNVKKSGGHDAAIQKTTTAVKGGPAQNEGIQPISKPETSHTSKQIKTVSVSGRESIDKISLKINQTRDDVLEKKPDEAIEQANLPNDAFSYESFLEVWDELAKPYKADSLGLFLAMTKNKPVIKKDHVVELVADNVIQADLVNEKKPELLSKLRKALRNYSIDIQTRINKSIKAEKAYLPTEKLEMLVKKNPAVEKLMKTFNLDLDY